MPKPIHILLADDQTLILNCIFFLSQNLAVQRIVATRPLNKRALSGIDYNHYIR
jgi:hypothetical protein